MTDVRGMRAAGGGEGTLRASILADAAVVTTALERRAMTVVELAEDTGLSLRQAYRTLRALEAAGWPVESSPDQRRSPKDGRVPCVYRMRRGASRSKRSPARPRP